MTTADGFILLAVGTDQQFARLLDVLDDAALAGRSAWRDNDARVRARDELRDEFDRLFVRHSTEHWLGVLRGSGVPHAPILDVAGAFAQDQIRERRLRRTRCRRPGGEVATMRTPL